MPIASGASRNRAKRGGSRGRMHRARGAKAEADPISSRLWASKGGSAPKPKSGPAKKIATKNKPKKENQNDNNAVVIDGVRELMEKQQQLLELKLMQKDAELEEMKKKLAKAQLRKEHSNVLSPRRIEELQGLSAAKMASRNGHHGAISEAALKNACERSTDEIYLADQGISGAMLGRLADHLAHIPSVTSLDISGNNLDAYSANALAALLSNSVGLRKLNLSRNNLGAEAVQAVCHTLRRNEKLEHLDISSNPFGRTVDIGRVVGNELAKNRSLRSVRVTLKDPKRVKFATSSNIVKFLDGLQASTTVEAVGIIGAQLSSISVRSIGRSIASGWLVEVDLSFGFMGPGGAKLLALAVGGKLRGNPVGAKASSSKMRLRKLNISYNAIGQIGCEAMMDAIARNRTIEELDLTRNNLNNESARMIASALLRNRRIVRLNLSRNAFGAGTGGRALVQALAKNTTVQSLGPEESMGFGPSLRRQLVSALRANAIAAGVKDEESEKGCALIYADLSSRFRVSKAVLSDDMELDTGPFVKMYDVFIKDAGIRSWKLCFLERLEASRGLRPVGIPGHRVLGVEWQLTRNDVEPIEPSEAKEETVSNDGVDYVAHTVRFRGPLHPGDTLQLWCRAPTGYHQSYSALHDAVSGKSIMGINMHARNLKLWAVGCSSDREEPLRQLNLFGAHPFCGQATAFA